MRTFQTPLGELHSIYIYNTTFNTKSQAIWQKNCKLHNIFLMLAAIFTVLSPSFVFL